MTRGSPGAVGLNAQRNGTGRPRHTHLRSVIYTGSRILTNSLLQRFPELDCLDHSLETLACLLIAVLE